MKTTFKTKRATYRLAGVLICLSHVDAAEINQFRQTLTTTGSTFTLKLPNADIDDAGSQAIIAIFENNLMGFSSIKQMISYKLRAYFAVVLDFIGINTAKIVVKY